MPELFTVEQIDYLNTHFDTRYDGRFVSQNDCDDVQKGVNRKFANDDKRIELLIHQQQLNNWLTTAIAGGIIALLIKVFLGG